MSVMYGVILGGIAMIIFGLIALYLDRRSRPKHL